MDLAQAKVAVDTLWVMLTACLVFFMNAGFALLESGLCQAKNAVNILAKNFIVFAVSSIAFWVVGFGADVRRRQPAHRARRAGSSGGADNSPATGDAYQGVFASLNWTGVPLDGEVLLPARVRRDRGHDRERRGGGADQVPELHRLLLRPGRRSSTRSAATGSGAAAWPRPTGRASTTSPARPSCTASAAGRRSPAS